MRSNKTASIFLSFLVLITSFITLCPAEPNKSAEIHFITEQCGSHDCNRNTDSHHCEKENTAHGFCDDRSISDQHRNNQIEYTFIASPVPLSIFEWSFETESIKADLLTFAAPPVPIFQRNTVLRI